MSALIRAKDWSNTALGATDTWPSSLTLVVNIMLASGFPMAVRWGPDFVMLYNDGYRPILGDKHPWALGLPFREVWPEVQPQLGPLHEAILAGERGAFFAEDLLLRIQRHAAEWEDARFTPNGGSTPMPRLALDRYFCCRFYLAAVTAETQNPMPIWNGNSSQGATLIIQYGCGSCHEIAGIPGAYGLVGPSLDNFGRRIYIAGMLRNSPDNLMRWLENPRAIVPGNVMPNMHISRVDARDIAAYLLNLK